MVKKGQAIGGTGQAGSRRGGMLPPSGAGPVEVTPEWVQEQQRAQAQSAGAGQLPEQKSEEKPAETEATDTPGPAAVAPAATARTAAGYLPMPEFTQPDMEDPADRLEFYSRGILAVQYAARANHERADQQRLIGLGLRLKAMKEEDLHRVAGFDTFGDLTESRFGIKKHQANNIIRVTPVAQALEDITTQELRERPLRVLVPILETHGEEPVRETWMEAARHGSVSDKALREAANFLGYAPPKELPASEETKAQERASPGPSESLRAVERIRTLAQKDPVQARREAEALESAVRELLEELAGNLE